MGSAELGSGVGELSTGLGSGVVGDGDGLSDGDGEVLGAGDVLGWGDVVDGGVGGREVVPAGLGVFVEDLLDRVVVPVTVPARDGAVLATTEGEAVGEAVGSAGSSLAEGVTSEAGAKNAAPPTPEGGAWPAEFVWTKPKTAKATVAPAAPATASAPTALRTRRG